MPDGYRNIARVVRPHGSKGEVLVAPLRGLPFLLREGMRVHITPPALGRERVSLVESVRETPQGARVLFSCARDLDDAEAIAGRRVLARLDDLDLGPLDVSFERLVGRLVVDPDRGAVGRISDVMETPANDVWVVTGREFGEVLVPVVEEVVESIPDDGPILVRLMDGLFDL